ncbi:MAG: hypothetical protein MRY63_04300 [Neomegalonema sp.]|nr:hypothetical protein [Neomegalonema sp.]
MTDVLALYRLSALASDLRCSAGEAAAAILSGEIDVPGGTSMAAAYLSYRRRREAARRLDIPKYYDPHTRRSDKRELAA